MPATTPNIGSRDRRIAVQSVTYTANEYGEPAETWTTDFYTLARVEYPQAGQGEGFEDAINISSTRIDFTIRWRSGITTKNRIVYNSNNYDIIAVGEIGRRNYLKLTAELKK